MLALDTNTISYFFRGEPCVVSRLLATPPSELAVPAIVAYELRYGLFRLGENAARSRLEALDQLPAPMTILDFDSGCASGAALLRCKLEAAGIPIGPHDLLIAATALAHGAALVSRNVREFSRVPGLEVVDWHAQPLS
jgi:tRNA(fMet)-specific endonuclease VapC